MGQRCIGIDLRHHQRNTLLHAEGTGVIHHHCTRGGDRVTPLPRHRPASGGQHKIHSLKRRSVHLLEGDRAAVPLLRAAGGACRSQQLQFSYRKVAFLEEKKQLLTDRTTGAENSNVEGTGWKRRGQAGGERDSRLPAQIECASPVEIVTVTSEP